MSGDFAEKSQAKRYMPNGNAIQNQTKCIYTLRDTITPRDGLNNSFQGHKSTRGAVYWTHHTRDDSHDRGEM